jgi:hypothetical protein
VELALWASSHTSVRRVCDDEWMNWCGVQQSKLPHTHLWKFWSLSLSLYQKGQKTTYSPIKLGYYNIGYVLRSSNFRFQAATSGENLLFNMQICSSIMLILSYIRGRALPE